MLSSKVVVDAARVLPVLSETQKRSQAARLGQAMPSLAAAYAQALARWVGDPVLRLAGLPIVTVSYQLPERQDELYQHGRSKPGPVVTYKRGESRSTMFCRAGPWTWRFCCRMGRYRGRGCC